MSELTTVFLFLVAIFAVPFICSFLLALFVVEEMPNENRRPASLKDCFKCMFYDGYSQTNYHKYQRLFLILHIPIIGFMVTITLLICFLIYAVFTGAVYILMRIPGVKSLCNSISNIYNTIVNYKFR